MKDTINVKWAGNMAFEANIDDHRIIVDAIPEVGGMNKGPRPKPLLLVSLAGCTAMDVISILNKMKVEVQDFSLKVEADLTEQHPKQFKDIHIIYEFTGKDLPYDKINHAIELSQEKYCGVSATLKKAITISYEIRLNNS